MADHPGPLVPIEGGRSLLPEIVQKELELQGQLDEARAQALKMVREAETRRDEAIAGARGGSSEEEEAFLQEELEKYEGELKQLEKSEAARLEDLRSRSEPKLPEATDAIVALVVEPQN